MADTTYKACGGCGATEPKQRCIGCLHVFHIPPSPDALTPRVSDMRDAEGQTTNCCKCGRIIDKREKSEGGDDFGAELTDGRWTCSIECWDAVVTPTPVPDAEGHKRGVEAGTAEPTIDEFVAAYCEARGLVACEAKPVGYVTGSNMRGLIDGVQGVMTVSNVQNALFQNPIYAEPPAQLEYKIAAWMVRENERDDWDFVRLKTSATDLEARGYEVTPLYIRTPKTEA